MNGPRKPKKQKHITGSSKLLISTQWHIKIGFWDRHLRVDPQKMKKWSTFNTWGQEVSCLGGLISPYDCVNGIIEAVPERVRIQVLCLSNNQITKILSKRGFTQHSERSKNPPPHSVRICGNERKTSELALEYMISSALRTTTGSFSCHSLFFLVAGLWASLTTLIKHMACNRVRGMHKREKKWGWGGDEKNPKPENLLNDGTSHGLVALAVPSPSHALVRPWPWARHLRNESVKLKPKPP